MLKGDLTSTPLASLLLDLASDDSSGCLQVIDADGEEALVYLKNGLLYSITVPSSRPQLGAKLVSSGALAPEALAEALEAQRTELQGWRLGELLVHLGYVDEPVVEAFVREQVHESLWDLLRWNDGHWKFKKNAKTREDVCAPMPVVDLLESMRERGYEWESISAIVHGPNAVPMLSARSDASNETTLDNDAWSMLCKIDGERTVSELARDCGYTLFEAGNVIVSLVHAGLVDIEEHVDPEGAALYGASALSSAFSDAFDDTAEPDPEPDDDDPLTRLARLVTEVASEQPGDDGGGTVKVVPPAQRTAEAADHALTLDVHRHSTESFAASIARVSTALSDVLGTPPPAVDDIDPLIETRRHRPRVTTPGTGEQESQRRRRLRSAAAAELASAQALAEALRPDRDLNAPETPSDAPPRLVDAEAERSRVAAREAEEAERHAAEQAAREAAARFAQAAAEEAERHAAAQEQARLAAEAEAERVAAEQEQARLAAEAEAERIAAERAAAELAARTAAEAAAEAARLAAEEAARIAAEQAAVEEAERLAREAAERAAAEEAERLAAERAAAEVEAWEEYWHREEQARFAAEEAERLAAEEAARLAAEEADRIAAEEAAEAERIAAAEAARIAAEEEAARIAAEEEAARVAAEEAARRAAEEAERIAAELEAARLAAEQAAAEEAARQAAEQAAAEEAARLAVEAAAARLAAEEAAAAAAAEKAEKAARRKADKEAAEEAARHADEAAAATAMLIELNATAPAPEPDPEPAVVAEPEPEPEPVVDDAGEFPDVTDTAALLRELSSLGTEEEERPLPTPVARAVNRPSNNGNDKKAKKKIGLFGL